MKLSAFQIINCFGFRNSGTINLNNARNFIYILGRNSSGKSSLLNAITYFERGITPSEQPNFQNFNDSGVTASLLATFVHEGSSLDEAAFIEALDARLTEFGINDHAFSVNPKLRTLREVIVRKYSELTAELNNQVQVKIWKTKDGHYHFFEDEEGYERRKREVSTAISAAQDKGVFNISGTLRNLSIAFSDFEDLLYRQFPSIYLFNEKYSLRDNLPDRIVINRAEREGLFEKLFVNYLGAEEVNQFLRSNDPDEREIILAQLNKQIKRLTDKVNSHRSQSSNTDLLEIRLHEKNGIQITVQTDKKKSYYSHLSDNTKFLFAYYLHQEANKISGNTLLFDEPSNGFHPTAQEFILNFLKQLADAGNLVVVATHSEHMIDLDFLSSVRLMSVDESRNITVKNHIYTQAKSPGDYLALQPILDAIGLRYGTQLTINDKVNVTEGITDLLYLRSFNKLLDYPDALAIAPARGNGTILNVVPLLISQGLAFKIVLDVGNVKEKLNSNFGINSNFIYEIPIPADFIGRMDQSGIEDLFTKADFEKLLIKIGHAPNPQYPHVSNSHYMGTSRDKRLVAQHLYENIADYTVDDFDAQTISNFRSVLDFCHNPSWYSL